MQATFKTPKVPFFCAKCGHKTMERFCRLPDPPRSRRPEGPNAAILANFNEKIAFYRAQIGLVCSPSGRSDVQHRREISGGERICQPCWKRVRSGLDCELDGAYFRDRAPPPSSRSIPSKRARESEARKDPRVRAVLRQDLEDETKVVDAALKTASENGDQIVLLQDRIAALVISVSKSSRPDHPYTGETHGDTYRRDSRGRRFCRWLGIFPPASQSHIAHLPRQVGPRPTGRR